MKTPLRRLLATLAVLLLIPLLARAQISTNGVIVWEATQQWANDIQAQLTSLQTQISSPKPVGIVYNFIGVPAATTRLSFVAPTIISLPANFAAGSSPAWASLCTARVAATSSTTFTIDDNYSPVATLNFGSNATTCTFSTQAAFSLAAGDTLTIISPASPDATLADIAITIGGSR